MTEIEALVREKMVRVLFFSWSLPSSAVCKPSDLSCWRVCFRRLSFQFFFIIWQPVNRERMAKHGRYSGLPVLMLYLERMPSAPL